MEHDPHNGNLTTIYFTKRPTVVNMGGTRLELAMGNTLQLMSSLFTTLWYNHDKFPPPICSNILHHMCLPLCVSAPQKLCFLCIYICADIDRVCTFPVNSLQWRAYSTGVELVL